MKRQQRKLVWVAGLLLMMAASLITVAQTAFGHDVFDRSGWQVLEDGSIRYLDYHGDPLLGWQEVEGETYYFHPGRNGTLHTGWLRVAGETYYLDEAGLKATGLMLLDEKRYCFNDLGVMQAGWKEIGKSTYFFTDSGAAHTGWLDSDRGRFYFDADGQMRTGWVETEEGTCYLSDTGAVTAGWVDTDRGRVYIDPEGTIHTGWLSVGDETCYLTEQGTLHTGWLDTEEGRYYLLEDGSKAVGEVVIDGIPRHFTSSGKYFVMVNPWNPVPEDYEANLVPFEGFQVDAACLEELTRMRADCLAAGLSFNLTSAYRSYEYQTTLFQRKVDKLMAQGYSRAAAESETGRSIAIPGTSEHQLGLAVDIKSGSRVYAWLAENSWKYGFILRYPSGATRLTGIYYEPWHFRYVGKELAQELYELDLCVEAYINILTGQVALKGGD